ncbi:MAG: ATP-dependent sacrificial sulfur transferase LarE [Candidatus Altiarchaeota archaeon]|nr:ATP-dependent sacrificial sulfur transferase LarE [Candidatus Altiarchaeota archaeon]
MLDEKYKKLCRLIGGSRRVLVAFSGGVDSSLLAKVSRDVLGENALAVTIDSEVMPRSELKEAKKIAREIGIEHLIVEIDFMGNKEFIVNTPLRCYYCKKEIMKTLKRIAVEKKLDVVLDGSNIDDLREDRPGFKALREEGVFSPLAEAGLGKNEVKKLARRLGLSNADRESNTCLATRIPLGEELTVDRLRRIDKAEEFIKRFGVRHLRVRDQGDVARIEAGDDIGIIQGNVREIRDKLRSLGYESISVDT